MSEQSKLTDELLASVDGRINAARNMLMASRVPAEITKYVESLLTIIEGLARELRAERAKPAPVEQGWTDEDMKEAFCAGVVLSEKSLAGVVHPGEWVDNYKKHPRPSPDKKGNTP